MQGKFHLLFILSFTLESLYSLHAENVTILTGLLCLIFLISFKNKITKQELSWMILPALFYLNDLVAGIFEELNVNGGNNHWYYNLANFFAYLYYLYLFYHLVERIKTKQLIKILCLIYGCIHLWYIFIYGSIFYLDVYGFIFGMTIVAIIAYLYLLELAEREDGLNPADFSFWFACAALVFNALVFLDMSISNELASQLWIINDIIYTFWYITLIIGLLWTRKRIQQSSF